MYNKANMRQKSTFFRIPQAKTLRNAVNTKAVKSSFALPDTSVGRALG